MSTRLVCARSALKNVCPRPLSLNKISTDLSTGCSPEQRPVIPQDHLRRVVAGSAGDAAAGVGAAAAVIKALQGPTIIGMAEHRTRREQLVQRQRAMEDIAAEQAELALQVEGERICRPNTLAANPGA
jgi:hypothetical protein